jgi:lipoprotein NlpD
MLSRVNIDVSGAIVYSLRMTRRTLLKNHVFIVALLISLAALSGLSGCAPTGVYHTIQPGQTLFRIAKTYEISEAELARVNRITDPTKLKVGQRIYIPGAMRPRKVAASVPVNPVEPLPRAPEPVSAPTSVPKPSAQEPTPSVPPAIQKQPSVKVPDPEKGFFIWPIKGRLLSQFGAKGGSANKGIEIACQEGAPIVAAAPGKVIYSGNGIRGYGHLIIIEHAQDYFTVYGYNRKNLVRTNDFVGQSDQIALCGEPQNSESPRLHFEIRKGKSAVDPIFYLP